MTTKIGTIVIDLDFIHIFINFSLRTKDYVTAHIDSHATSTKKCCLKGAKINKKRPAICITKIFDSGRRKATKLECNLQREARPIP